MYPIKTIQNLEQLNECPVFNINHFLWNNVYKPKSYGRMAYLDKIGVIVHMTAIEKNPLRIYTEENDPVYKDSALEVFINFSPEDYKEYLNFEMNANGAVLSQFGKGRDRKLLNQLSMHLPTCEATILDDSWSILLTIPLELISDIYKKESINIGDIITCNFFKISEDPEHEHYASYSLINSPSPNFHLPEFFAQGIIQ